MLIDYDDDDGDDGDDVDDDVDDAAAAADDDDDDDYDDYGGEYSDTDSDNYIDDNEFLNTNRAPVYVYKYPVDGTYGSMFQGFETLKDEVLDLSHASDKELKEFYSLPRSFR